MVQKMVIRSADADHFTSFLSFLAVPYTMPTSVVRKRPPMAPTKPCTAKPVRIRIPIVMRMLRFMTFVF